MKRSWLIPLASILATVTLAGPASAATPRKAATTGSIRIAGEESYYSNSFRARHGAVKVVVDLKHYVPQPLIEVNCDAWWFDFCDDYQVQIQRLNSRGQWDFVAASPVFRAQGQTDVVTFDGGIGTKDTYRIRVKNLGPWWGKGPITIDANVDPDGNGL